MTFKGNSRGGFLFNLEDPDAQNALDCRLLDNISAYISTTTSLLLPSQYLFKMSLLDGLLARNRELIDGFSQEQPRAPPTYEELEAERNTLLEQVLTLLKEQTDSADNVRYIATLEVRLKETREELQEEKSKRQKSEKRCAQLEKSLGEANDSLHQTALAMKMYQAISQDSNEMVAPDR